MAIIHRASITPTKLELLEEWLGDDLAGSSELHQVGGYRFDDPDGEVGIEALLVTRGEAVRHVVLTYRPAPLDGAEDHLITTMEHSVLGQRWVYDGQGDPVAVAAYQRALAGQQEQAPLEIWDGATLVDTRQPTVELSVHNAATSPDGLDVHWAAEIGAADVHGPGLFARWDGGEGLVAWA
jgi:Maltokinase N-terminal cap domain